MLSVILINYNHARYLPQSLKALLSQTRPPEELIIVDDASTDDSVAVISQMIAGHRYAYLLRNDENRGALYAGHLGRSEARGDFLCYAAADDEVSPRLFEVALGLLESYPEAAFFSSASRLMDEASRPMRSFAMPRPLSAPGYVSPALAARVLMRDDGWFMANTAIYRRSLLDAAGGFPQDVGGFADGYLMRYLALRHGACYSPEELGTWRRVEGSLSRADILDLARARATAAAARAHMVAHPNVFPPGYAARWARRHLFSAYALRFQMSLRGQGALGQILVIAYKLALFSAMRPGDIAPTLFRYLGRPKPTYTGPVTRV